MKKLFYLLLLLPVALLASCSDDDDLPNVDITVNLDNVVDYHNQLYAVRGDTIEVTSVDIKGNEGKKAVITSVTYFWNNTRLVWNPLAPFQCGVDTRYTATGTYNLIMTMDIAQVDKTIAYSVLDQIVTVVADESDLPDGLVPGPVSKTYTLSAKHK